MKTLLSIIVALLVLAGCESPKPPFVEVSPKPERYAWWLRAQYHPFGKGVRGIPITEIRPDWCAANEFKRELFPKELLTFNDENMLDGASFALTGKFDGVTPLTALVGAYETCSKQKGLFFLILDESDKNAKPKVVFSDVFEDMQTFAYLTPSSNNEITVFWCYACDSFSRVQWNKDKKQFEWAEIDEPGED